MDLDNLLFPCKTMCCFNCHFNYSSPVQRNSVLIKYVDHAFLSMAMYACMRLHKAHTVLTWTILCDMEPS